MTSGSMGFIFITNFLNSLYFSLKLYHWESFLCLMSQGIIMFPCPWTELSFPFRVMVHLLECLISNLTLTLSFFPSKGCHPWQKWQKSFHAVIPFHCSLVLIAVITCQFNVPSKDIQAEDGFQFLWRQCLYQWLIHLLDTTTTSRHIYVFVLDHHITYNFKIIYFKII